MKNKKKILSIRWMIFAVLVTAAVGTVTLSRYMTVVTGTDTVVTAKFDVKMASQAKTMDFNGSDYNGDAEVQSYPFTITSNSEVTVDYSVKVDFGKAIPAQVSLWIDDNEAEKLSGDGEKTSFSFEGFTCGLEEAAKTHNLNIQVEYVDEVKDTAHKFTGLENVQMDITVIAKQKMPIQ